MELQLIAPHTESVPAREVARKLRETGYVVLDRALTADCIARINADTGHLRPALNVNWPGPVLYKNQRYLTHCLAHSRTLFDLMTRSWCFEVMKAYFGSGFRLTDQRVYVTTRQERMQWHVDNKLDDSAQTDHPGLIFIFYLCDVDDGELQVIDGSARWSDRQRNADFRDAFIDAQYAKDIVSLKMPAGSGIVYNTRVVHRAHRIRRPGWERKSLLFQVEKKSGGGEPVLLDTRFARNLTPEQMYFLGFGSEPEYDVFPQTSLNTIRPGGLMRYIRQTGAALARSSVLTAVWSLGPDWRAFFRERRKGSTHH